ncbi:MAG: hypothetical protein ACOYB7_17740 [Mycobacterium sp.]
MTQARRMVTLGALVALATGLSPGTAAADEVQHNVTYRARVDGIARGAEIYYRISDTEANSANPMMLPGRTFETTGVLTDAKQAGMRISIQWPYSANLTCEILVDDEIVIQASQFISPRLTPVRNDPDYGAMNCGAPLDNLPGGPPVVLDGTAQAPLPVTAVRPPDAAPS